MIFLANVSIRIFEWDASEEQFTKIIVTKIFLLLPIIAILTLVLLHVYESKKFSSFVALRRE